MEEALRTFMGAFGGGGSIFDNFFSGGGQGGGRSGRSGPMRGADMRYDLEIDFEDAVLGAHSEITYTVQGECDPCSGTGVEPGTKKEKCLHCGGAGVVETNSGFFQMRQHCPVCRGTGTIIKTPCTKCRGSGRNTERRKLTINIPAGVETGSRLRVAGKGEGGANAGPAGDLYVILHVREHAIFRRQDDDVFCKIPIPIETATLGGTIKVPTIHGFANLKIPSGTENGKIFRLRGKGIVSPTHRSKGDHHVGVVIEVPRKLSGPQKKKMKEWAESFTQNQYIQNKEFYDCADAFYERKEAMKK